MSGGRRQNTRPKPASANGEARQSISKITTKKAAVTIKDTQSHTLASKAGAANRTTKAATRDGDGGA